MIDKIQVNAEIETLRQQLDNKNREIIQLKTQLQEQEKLADLGMLVGEILHDQGNAISHIGRAARVTVNRLSKIEQAFDDADIWIGEEIRKRLFCRDFRQTAS